MTITDTNQQLTLLPSASLPARFLLSENTRRRGLAHIAELRAQMANREISHDITKKSDQHPIHGHAA